MTTLAADVRADDPYIVLDSTVGLAIDEYYQIDSEYVQIRTSPQDSQRVYVARGVLGTTAVAHQEGDDFTAVVVAVQTNSPSNPPASEVGAGAVQTVSLLGPFRVNWNTAGAVDPDNGLALGTNLDVGSIVEVFAVVVAAFDDDATADVGIGTDAAFYSAVNYDLTGAVVAAYVKAEGRQPDTNATILRLNIPHKVVVTAAARVMVAIWSATGNITQGAVDIYALVAAPV